MSVVIPHVVAPFTSVVSLQATIATIARFTAIIAYQWYTAAVVITNRPITAETTTSIIITATVVATTAITTAAGTIAVVQ